MNTKMDLTQAFAAKRRLCSALTEDQNLSLANERIFTSIRRNKDLQALKELDLNLVLYSGQCFS